MLKRHFFLSALLVIGCGCRANSPDKEGWGLDEEAPPMESGPSSHTPSTPSVDRLLINHTKSESWKGDAGDGISFPTFGKVEIQFGGPTLWPDWPEAAALYEDAQTGEWAVILPGELFGDSNDHRFEIPTTEHQLEVVTWVIDSGFAQGGKIAIWFTVNPRLRPWIPLNVKFVFSYEHHTPAIQRGIWGLLPPCVEPRLQVSGRQEVSVKETCHGFDVRSLDLTAPALEDEDSLLAGRRSFEPARVMLKYTRRGE